MIRILCVSSVLLLSSLGQYSNGNVHVVSVLKNNTNSIKSALDEELRDKDGFPIPYLYSKIPIESETFPELKGSIIWNSYYNFSTHSTDHNNDSSGYDVNLISNPNCNPDLFKGDCYNGNFSAWVNVKDSGYTEDKFQVLKEPLSDKPVPLAYGITGYIYGIAIRFLYKQGEYWIDGSRYPLENVILANAANVDLKDPKGPNYNKPFGGTVGQKLKLNMQLRRSGKWLWGTYAYNLGKPVAVQDRLYVVGSVAPDGVASLREYSFDNQNNKANQTGLFRGKLVGDKTFSGTWSAPDGKKTLPFSLQAK